MPGSGKYFIKVDRPIGVIRLWIYNFEVGRADLKKEHTDVLDQFVVPAIKAGGNIKLLGIASTTGADAANRRLSEARCTSVERFLRGRAGTKFAISKNIGMGEAIAKAFKSADLKGGTDDNVESEVWRGVVINAWNRDLPPPPSPPFDAPFESKSWVSDAGTVLDKAGMAVTLIDMAADIFAIEALAAVTGPLGLIIASVQAIAGLPLLFLNADLIANTNGQIQGAADAIQDMCDQFSADGLQMTPYSKWPAIKVPEPHILDNPLPTQNQIAWRAGQREGLQTAVKNVLEREQNPKEVTTPDGKHIKISGRLWLRAASKTFKDQCGVKLVIEPMNEKLREQGRPPWPTR